MSLFFPLGVHSSCLSRLGAISGLFGLHQTKTPPGEKGGEAKAAVAALTRKTRNKPASPWLKNPSQGYVSKLVGAVRLRPYWLLLATWIARQDNS